MRHINFIREGRAIPRPTVSNKVKVHTAGSFPNTAEAQSFRYSHAYGRSVRCIVCLGQSQGQIRPGLDVDTVTRMLFGIIVPAGILWHLTDGGFDVTRHAQRAWQLLSSAIINHGRPPSFITM